MVLSQKKEECKASSSLYFQYIMSSIPSTDPHCLHQSYCSLLAALAETTIYGAVRYVKSTLRTPYRWQKPLRLTDAKPVTVWLKSDKAESGVRCDSACTRVTTGPSACASSTVTRSRVSINPRSRKALDISIRVQKLGVCDFAGSTAGTQASLDTHTHTQARRKTRAGQRPVTNSRDPQNPHWFAGHRALGEGTTKCNVSTRTRSRSRHPVPYNTVLPTVRSSGRMIRAFATLIS